MSRRKQVTYWACDFETTAWGHKLEEEKGRFQDKTEVWGAADVALYDETETVTITHSIRDFIYRFLRMDGHNVLYFHNLSFDGSFIVDFLLNEGWSFTRDKEKDMRSKTFNASISDMGQWYWIRLKYNKTVLEIRDSLKLMPSSLAIIGKSFHTKHQKLEMNYNGERYAYCEITPSEEDYIKNDVLVLKEALEMMFNQKHDKLTIGSCCISEYKEFFSKQEWNSYFPDIREDNADGSYTGVWNHWDYVHRAYQGGWCYVNPKYRRRVIQWGLVYDVNSLYPSVMHSISDSRYPIGHGTYCYGKIPENILYDKKKYSFIRLRCRFKLKEKCFPWLHIRGSIYYKANENLYTSDVRWKGKYYRYHINKDGEVLDTIQEVTLTMTDYLLLLDTYDLYDVEYLDYVWFHAVTGIFDEYINKYAKIKMNSSGFMRELAKLFLNNLYGKFATSDNSSYKKPYLGEDNVVHFELVEEHEKKVGYIPVGAAITSYARNFTIRHAMANYDRFIYADTDSIHLIGIDAPNMIEEHPTDLCKWKCEGKFDIAFYERQKMYCERMVEKKHKPCDPDLQIKAAGMSPSAKKKFIDDGYNITQLTVGLHLEDCNLKATRVPGGIILREKAFNPRESIDKKITPVYNICSVI